MPSRRRFLAASGAAASAAVTAGCSSLPVGDDPVPLGDDYPTSGDATTTGGWGTHRCDGANTACARDASPVENPSIEWESPQFGSVQRPAQRTLTVDAATVYTGGKAIHGFDVLSGDPVWTSEDVFATRIAPDVHEGVAWTRAGPDSSTVVGLDASTGGEVRRREFDVELHGEPSVTRGRDASRLPPYLVAQTAEGGVAGVVTEEPEREPLWETSWAQDLFAGGVFRPATTQQVAVTSHAGEVYRFGASGYPAWRTDLRRRPRSSPVVGATRLYVATRRGAVALDRETGAVDWEYTDVGVDGDATGGRTQTGVRRSAVAFDGARVFLSGSKSLHAVSAKTGQRLWRHEFDETPTALPAVGGDRVYVGTDTEVHALGVDGTHHWAFDVDDPIGETLAVTDGRLFTLANRGREDDVAVVSLA
ncbi:outer membrane protein assembly factor BamB family protein [Halobacterium rubrum]|uniref:outer membrane protein assembly factor BamB family protein n=1 Tax=Halobacterium TaxID=2239 RepID=UPI001F27AF18|nr:MULTISPECIES: PQQ-binding-like beta-propeller repeat protein [Halobacterium]MDH5019366.1 PQQ-binding-like beta-propeller repeat protein [Halobacterium rubrum]